MPNNDKPIVGIDLGGTNMQIGVVDKHHKLLGDAKKKTRPDDGKDAVITRIVEGVQEACAAARLTPADLAAVGIGAPGALDPATGHIFEAVNLRWNDVPLADLLQKRLGVPAFVDNDVRSAAVGEQRLGAGDNARDMLAVWIGTGVGGGLILNNALFYGHFCAAGELGHTVLFPGNPPGSRTLEENCSRSAIVDRLTRLIRSNHKSALTDLVAGKLEDIKSKTIAKAYQTGDELTVSVIHNAADLLGLAIANIVTVLSLPRIVLGGGLTEALGGPWVDQVKRAVRAHVFPDKARAVKVVGTKLADDAGVYGAALLARDRLP